MTTFTLLLLIYGLILNLNEFTLAIEEKEKSERTILRSFRHVQQQSLPISSATTSTTTITPTTIAEPTTTTEESDDSTLTYILIALGIGLAIVLGIVGFVVYKKCFKKKKPSPSSAAAVVEAAAVQPPPEEIVVEEKVEAAIPTTPRTDGLNHPSTFCDGSTIALTDVGAGTPATGENKNNNNSAAVEEEDLQLR